MPKYRIANDKISGEIIDDELIVINLERGLYFTSKGGALPLWTALVAGCDLEAVKVGLAARSADAQQFISATDLWLTTFVERGLVSLVDAAAAPIPEGLIEGLSDRDLQAPTVEMHQDLADILVYDPVHDFDEVGWPKQPGV